MTRVQIEKWNGWSVGAERVQSVWVSPEGQVVVLGCPPSDDEERPEGERHNCDAMGCGQDHVIARLRMPTPETPSAKINPVVRERLEQGDYVRASGDALCSRCGVILYDHPEVPGVRWLRFRCDGQFVKL